MEIEILNQNGSGDSKVSLAEGIFNQEFNQDLVHQLVNTYIHNSHQRTKGQKNRSAVRGGGKKPWKQKGTGRARAGTIRSPIWRGGGMTFATKHKEVKPKKINKKMYRSAMRSIWSKIVENEKLVIVKEIQIDEPPKSSQVKTILSNLGVQRALIIISETNENLIKASKNLTECKIQTINSLDPSALIQADKVLVTSDALEKITDNLSK
jgi:large subunit ribosomal protein L4